MGLKVHPILPPISLTCLLKSDQDGIESYFYHILWFAHLMLKSDQDGIESRFSSRVTIFTTLLKSDQDGIESWSVCLTRPPQYKVKIRPRWDWKHIEAGQSKIKGMPLKSDQDGIERMYLSFPLHSIQKFSLKSDQDGIERGLDRPTFHFEKPS